MEINNKKTNISARVEEYSIPPLKDMLVLGKLSPIGCIAMRRAIELLIRSPFEHIELEDDVISDILIRQPVLRRISKDRLIDFVLTNLKPMMGSDEVLHVELDISVFLNDGS